MQEGWFEGTYGDCLLWAGCSIHCYFQVWQQNPTSGKELQLTMTKSAVHLTIKRALLSR